MIEIQHVMQSCDTDCGPACLSMVSGVPLEELNERYSTTNGMGKRELCDALRDLGVRHRVSLYNDLNYGHAWIATVCSRNFPERMHFVVIDCRRYRNLVFDPQRGRQGKKAYRCLDDLHTWADLIAVVPQCRQHVGVPK